MSVSVQMMRNHWWWRPGWRPGRSFYTWHLTFEEDSKIREYTDRYTSLINNFNSLDRVSPDGLHVTLQGIGFTDEVARTDIDNILSMTQPHISKLRPFQVEIGPAHVDTETVQAPLNPIQKVDELRTALRRGIGDTWGDENIPEHADHFHPHLTLAYSNGTLPVADVATALDEAEPEKARTKISTVTLIELNRDNQRYEWFAVSTFKLGI